MQLKMWKFTDQQIATVCFLLIAGMSMWLKKCQEDVQPEGDVPFHLKDEYPDFQGNKLDDVIVDEESNKLYLAEGVEILDSLNYNDLGMLIVPFEECPNFTCAFAYARCRLGDTETTGEMQYFIWRGGFYHTETLEDL